MSSSTAPRLTRSTHELDRRVVLRLTGEIDMEVEADMTAWLREAMSRHPGRDVVVDLAGVSFVDSSGIACLMIAYREATAGGVRLTVTGAQGPVLMVLTVTGVLEVLSGPNDNRRDDR